MAARWQIGLMKKAGHRGQPVHDNRATDRLIDAERER
jgi:hypothetical protein